MKEQGVDLRIVFDGDVTPGKVTEKAERIAKAQAAIDACRRAGAEAVLTWTSGSNKTKLQSAAAGFCNANLVTAVQNELTQDGLGAIIAPYEGDEQVARPAGYEDADRLLRRAAARVCRSKTVLRIY
jgi:hypothetical protein